VLTVIETWRAPHAFTLLPVEGESSSHGPIAVFTSGPIAPDLAQLTRPTPALVSRLGRSLGLEWIASLVEIDRPPGLEEAALMRYLREEFDLRPGSDPSPFVVRRGTFVRPRPQVVPGSLLADFVANEHGRLKWMGSTIRRLVMPLVAAAEGRGWNVGGQQERATDLFNALEPSLKLQRLTSPAGERPTHGFVPMDLYARALLEIIELYDHRPRVAICSRCGRLFVARREGQRSCRRYVWLWRGREAVGGCVFDQASTPRRVDIDARAHRREYTRLQMRVSRAVKTFGPDNPRTKREIHDFDHWKKSNPVPRGRRPNPVDPDLLPWDA
jgi:hypothetical protein